MDFIDFLHKVIRKLMRLFWGLIYTGYAWHLVVGLLLGSIFALLFYRSTNNRLKSMFLGIMVATFVGILKEVIDPYVGRNRDLMDLVYTVIGGAMGAMIILWERISAKLDFK